MPVYNGEKYLAQAINSILQQTYSNFELLIINDGSTDNSLSIIKSFNDSRIRLLNNPTNLGLVITRNKGISEARGKYIAMLDCDDVALPQRLALQVDFLNQNPEYGVVGSQIMLVDDEGKISRIIKYKAKPQFISSILFFNNYLAQSSVLVRVNLIKVLQYRLEYPMAEDYDLWVRLARVTKIKIIQEPLVKYRLHANNITKQKAAEEANAIRAILIQQLEHLKVRYTPTEFELHCDIARYNFKNNKEFINNSATWLYNLYNVNLKSRIYPDKEFASVILERYALICGNSGLGRWALLRFLEFPLLKFSKFNIFKIMNVFVKTMSGYKNSSL